MPKHNHAVTKAIPTPVATDLDDADNDPGVAPISDNSSLDFLLYSCTSESEVGIWGNNNYDDDAFNAHDRTNLVPPDFNENEGVMLPTLSKLPRELLVELMGKQKIIHQPCGAAVLMENWNACH